MILDTTLFTVVWSSARVGRRALVGSLYGLDWQCDLRMGLNHSHQVPLIKKLYHIRLPAHLKD